MVGSFRNEPFVDFSVPENRRAMEEAVARVRSSLGRHYPLVIGGDSVTTREEIASTNPARPAEIVGYVSKADPELADRAIRSAYEAFGRWSRYSPDARARVLLRAAAIMRRRRLELNAWQVLEVGKTWVEADVETAEAIDFLEYYAREMMRLGAPQPLTPLPGEENEQRYIPLGVVVVIPPWNFPLSILTGMTSAALVAGNTVVLKPSSLSPVIGAKVADILFEAGIPEGVLNFTPGSGGAVGDVLVSHPLTRMIAFTGSKEVGLRINELAARSAPGQKWIKRVIAEMGGKNAVIVDESADLPAAAQAIVTSAFGFQGQKCSAGSRAILLDAVHDRVLEMIVERTKALRIGDPALYETQVGPVVDLSQFKKVLEYIDVGRREGRLVAGGRPFGESAERPEQAGYFIEPTVFADVQPQARIAQEEIFGPVLAVIRARDFDHALEIANGTEYGLTGSVYARDRAKLEKARHEFHVGNLYFNRKCTGALVGVHPFGGFNMSGTDSKAGGPDYLLLFTQAKAISEVL
ncbi:MAG: L-glutamate gamma-semialdehyde dehydrogenase [Limnochordaceae bacterium]|nr:L-glutamate gamma-semialdehyde dehydrogenase [Limnochordaceae bacterium]